jgi:hypothetical protein
MTPGFFTAGTPSPKGVGQKLFRSTPTGGKAKFLLISKPGLASEQLGKSLVGSLRMLSLCSRV